MPGPISLAVEDDAEVRQELNDDLLRRYGADYHRVTGMNIGRPPELFSSKRITLTSC